MIAIKNHRLMHTYPDGTIASQGWILKLAAGEKGRCACPNGSGKSHTVLSFQWTHQATRVEIKCSGRIVRKDNIDMIRKRVGIVFQSPDTPVVLAYCF